MVKQVVFTKPFLSELEEILNYIATFYSEESAKNIHDMLLERISLLEQFPFSGHVISIDDERFVYRIVTGITSIILSKVNLYV